MARHTAVSPYSVQYCSLPRSVTNGTLQCDEWHMTAGATVDELNRIHKVKMKRPPVTRFCEPGRAEVSQPVPFSNDVTSGSIACNSFVMCVKEHCEDSLHWATLEIQTT